MRPQMGEDPACAPVSGTHESVTFHETDMSACWCEFEVGTGAERTGCRNCMARNKRIVDRMQNKCRRVDILQTRATARALVVVIRAIEAV